MPTLGDLRQRIITETVRSDLAGGLATVLDQQIQSAIYHYASERFWFNEVRSTGTLTANAEYTPLPSGQREIDRFYIVIGQVRYELSRRSMEELEGLYTVPQTGQPSDWAYFGTQARLWPTPGQAYPTIWLTISDVTPVLNFTTPGAANASSNNWTTDGFNLITARTKMNLYRDQFRDDEAYAQAAEAEKQAYATLKGQSNRRLSTGRIRPSW